MRIEAQLRVLARRCNVLRRHLLSHANAAGYALRTANPVGRLSGSIWACRRARNVLEDALLPFAGQPIVGDRARAHPLLRLL